MCGIFGAVGQKSVRDIITGGLKKLEYRGYDSAGIAFQSKTHSFPTLKTINRVDSLISILNENLDIDGSIGIGHTRWATHGGVSIANAHPHISNDYRVCIVHNGVIDNCDDLRRNLQNQHGVKFNSETDTEVIVNLIEFNLKKNYDPIDAMERTMAMLQGTYGLAIMFQSEPDKIFFAKNGSPLVIGFSDNEKYVSSDQNALIDKTNRVIFLNDGNWGWISSDSYRVFGENTKIEKISAEDGTIELGDFPNFMLKEICEQPLAINRCFGGRIRKDNCVLGGFGLSYEDLSKIQSITIIGCGTSYHAGLVAKKYIEDWAEIPVFVELASEFLSKKILSRENAIYIAISQSGETYDTLECVKELKIRGKSVYGVVNTVGSSIARLCGGGVYIHAGPEVAVASTKAFTSQLAAMFMFSIMIARTKGRNLTSQISKLRDLPQIVDNYIKILTNGRYDEKHLKKAAKYIAESKYCLFLGRQELYPVAMEGALKLKEIAYVPCEAYASGEMKHGPIAMITDGTPVICLMPYDKKEQDKMRTAIREVKARGAKIITIGSTHVQESDFFISLCYWHPWGAATTVIALQLLAYHAAIHKGLDVDKPRNLAKSVTVS